METQGVLELPAIDIASKFLNYNCQDPHFNLENMYHLLPAALKTTLISGKSLKSGNLHDYCVIALLQLNFIFAGITSIVKSSSLCQSSKGLATAGIPLASLSNVVL